MVVLERDTSTDYHGVGEEELLGAYWLSHSLQESEIIELGDRLAEEIVKGHRLLPRLAQVLGKARLSRWQDTFRLVLQRSLADASAMTAAEICLDIIDSAGLTSSVWSGYRIGQAQRGERRRIAPVQAAAVVPRLCPESRERRGSAWYAKGRRSRANRCATAG
jgi:hypothetical protein